MILTVHLEDYFQVSSLDKTIPSRYWPRFEPRLEQNVDRTLRLLDKYNCTATFFTLGWIADHFPEIISEVSKRGHNIASKGYYYRSLKQMSAEEFRADAVRSKVAIEKACHRHVEGYRIARGWLSNTDMWLLDILAAEGFTYDSSLRHIGFNPYTAQKKYQKYIHKSGNKEIWELPISSNRFLGFSLPISGGNYLRQLPDNFIKKQVASWQKHKSNPMVFYFHTWELDPEQPRFKIPPLKSIRQYRNLDIMPEKIEYYLKTYKCCSIEEYLGLKKHRLTPNQNQVVIPETSIQYHKPRKEISLVVPCYNEEPTLVYLYNTLRQFEKKFQNELIVNYVFVDDGSSDKTWEKFYEIFGHWQNATFIQHKKNRGVAAASLTGIQNASSEIVCVIDSDCTYDPIQLIKMIEMLDHDTALVTASPYHPKGTVLNVPKWRLFLSWVLSRFYRTVMNHKFDTYTACFRVYRKSLVQDLSLENEGYLGMAEIFSKLDSKGLKIVEAPAILEARLFGQSKMKTLRTIFGHIGFLTSLLSRRFFSKSNKNKLISVHEK